MTFFDKNLQRPY